MSFVEKLKDISKSYPVHDFQERFGWIAPKHAFCHNGTSKMHVEETHFPSQVSFGVETDMAQKTTLGVPDFSKKEPKCKSNSCNANVK